MVKLSHFGIEILQDGVVANEYADKDAEDALDQETRYVEVKEGKAFAIRLTVDEHFDFEGYDALSVEVSIDGKWTGGICYQRYEFNKGSVIVEVIEGFTELKDGSNYLKCFRFEEAETRQLKKDEKLPDVLEQYKDQGSISVEISRVCGTTYLDQTDDSNNKQQDIVPEKVVKDKSSSTKTRSVSLSDALMD